MAYAPVVAPPPPGAPMLMYAQPAGTTAAPVAASGDPLFANVVALLHLDGANNATSTSDSSGSHRAITFAGNARLDTAQKEFGASSLYLDGAGDYISMAASADFNIGQIGALTLEMGLRFTAMTGDPYLINLSGDNGVNRSALQYNTAAGTLSIFRALSGSGTAVATANLGLTTATWYHIAWVVAGTNTRLFLNGTQVLSTTLAYANVNSPLILGAANPVASSNYLNGHIEEFRATKSAARYLANFTPPTAAHPNSV